MWSSGIGRRWAIQSYTENERLLSIACDVLDWNFWSLEYDILNWMHQLAAQHLNFLDAWSIHPLTKWLSRQVWSTSSSLWAVKSQPRISFPLSKFRLPHHCSLPGNILLITIYFVNVHFFHTKLDLVDHHHHLFCKRPFLPR